MSPISTYHYGFKHTVHSDIHVSYNHIINIIYIINIYVIFKQIHFSIYSEIVRNSALYLRLQGFCEQQCRYMYVQLVNKSSVICVFMKGVYCVWTGFENCTLDLVRESVESAVCLKSEERLKGKVVWKALIWTWFGCFVCKSTALSLIPNTQNSLTLEEA